ncbi:protein DETOXIFICATION 49-like [Abrus precatorius]|uniref:Protein DETOXIFICATION n=1 Tax=Abrus precatorius TaxID=3816 RepID=A0A8B8KRN3_ABRPR|nr:protein DETOXIFICATION 49-like [Abrus precatorius]
MHEENPSSDPLLSNYGNSKLEESSKSNELSIDNDCDDSRSSLVLEVMEEIKDLYTIAFPTIITSLLLYGKSAISMHFLGKLGKEALAGGCLAIGMANITGYSIISGLAAGMEGISSQACGAQQWVLISETLQCTIMLLILTCIPISILWLNFEPILLLCGQDPTISSVATTYLAFTLPDLILQSFINPLKIYLRAQSLTLPLMFSAALALVLHALINYVIVHTFSLGIQGVALASAFTDLNLLIIILLYLWFSGACSKSWHGWSHQCFNRWKPILHQAIPSCVSICLEWWWYELLILLSGLLTNAADTVATTGIIIQATALTYNFPFALSLAVSTRVGNELGANKPNKAKTSSFTALLCAFFTGIISMTFMVTTSNIWGRMFTDDEAILSLLAKTLPIVGLCEVGNCPQTTICGMLRGSARPTLGANINLVSFYIVGLPVALLMGFVFDLGLLGLLLGLLAAQIVCAIVMVVVLARTDWTEQANRARELVGEINEDNGENNEGIEESVSIVSLN